MIPAEASTDAKVHLVARAGAGRALCGAPVWLVRQNEKVEDVLPAFACPVCFDRNPD